MSLHRKKCCCADNDPCLGCSGPHNDATVTTTTAAGYAYPADLAGTYDYCGIRSTLQSGCRVFTWYRVVQSHGGGQEQWALAIYWRADTGQWYVSLGKIVFGGVQPWPPCDRAGGLDFQGYADPADLACAGGRLVGTFVIPAYFATGEATITLT